MSVAAVLILFVVLLAPMAEAGGFAIFLPADSAVTIDASSRLAFMVTNREATESLSRLALRFPAGYRVRGGSAPPGWTVEQAAGESGEVSFRTSDEAKCTGAIAPGSSLVFGVEVIAPASRSVFPDSLVSAQGEQSCRGVVLDPPATFPSWDRLGIEVALAAGPPVLGLGGEVTATMNVMNLSTIAVADISPLLTSGGTGSVSGLLGPTPASLSLAPGASGTMTWTGRAASPGTVNFSGQAISKSVTSSPVRSGTLFVGDLEVSLTVTPEQVVSGQDVQVQMTVTNRGPARVANVTPTPLTFDGTATASAPAGPSPASQPLLEPGESTIFAWAATITGRAGETYAFSGWASADWGAIVSASAASNRGEVAQQAVAGGGEGSGTSLILEGGGSVSAENGTAASTTSTAAASTGGSSAAAVPSATLQFVGVNHNGSQTGGTGFSSGLLRDLRMIVAWSNLSGSHTQRLDLFGPDGSLYQGFSAQFSSTPVETRLLVSGTWITEYSLFGAWRVDVYLDGERMPITSGVFVLTP